jgi:hypothetical protein
MGKRTGIVKQKWRDIAGQKFGKLTAIKPVGPVHAFSSWICRCDCGTEKVLRFKQITEIAKSCGCACKEAAATFGNRRRKHGMDGTPMYRLWYSMRNRCNYKKHKHYADYGGRGIKVCSRWDSFENFLADMGERPSPKYEIERIDNNGPYAPWNCKWATRKEQMNNTRRCRYLTLGDRILTVTQWAEKLGVNKNTIRSRVRIGWSDKEILLTPFR